MNHLVTTILVIVLCFTLYLVITSKTSGENANLFGYQIKTVLSGSMEPDIKTGSIILIEVGGDMTRFQEDDVITYITEEEILVTHRVTEIQNGGKQFITKGDANDGVDINPVLAENIVGKYVGITIPFVGYIMSFATSKQGVALLLIAPGVLLILRSFFILWNVVRYTDQIKHQENEG